ncbi:hypothetical protein ACFSTC_14180 [Nonomuraea ferruginea]
MARWIAEWHPDDAAFWRTTGRKVARRNLVFSILAEHLGFTVWTLWSIVAARMGGYEFTTDQLFWLVALPNLIGSVLRVPYTFGLEPGSADATSPSSARCCWSCPPCCSGSR